ncbi:MAG: DUF362 domain-containing protein [Acidobacteriota bacterium]
MNKKEIALIKETRQSKFLNKIMETISPHINIKPSDKIAIKINLSGSREIYANTHYETVEGLIIYLRDTYGVSDITVIEGSDGAYQIKKSTWDIFYKFRYKEVELMGVKLVNLDELPHDGKFEAKTLTGSREVSHATFESDYTITIVPPKTHHLFPVFLSIPNMTGYVKAEEREFLYGSVISESRKLNMGEDEKFLKQLDFAGKNFAELLKRVSPSLVIVDGLYGMEGKGPVKGSPVFHGFAIASEDPVLADALTTYIMGFDVEDVPYIHYSNLAGLGNITWQNVLGVDPVKVKFPYRPHPNYQKQKQWKASGSRKNGGKSGNDREKRGFKNHGEQYKRKDKTS